MSSSSRLSRPLSRDADRSTEIRAAFHRVFNTRDGEVVLAYLEERFYDCVIKNDQMAREVGRRDVVSVIRQLMKEKRDD